MRKLTMSIVCLFVIWGISAQEQWNIYSDVENVKIYTRQPADSDFKEIKIEMELRTDVESFMEKLNNAEGYTDWVYKCSSSERIKTINENEFIYYVETDMPFPIKNRDLVIHSRQQVDPVTKTIYSSSKAVPQAYPLKPDVVRVEEYESTWMVAPQPSGTIKVKYWSRTNPGGNLPAWLVNMGVTLGPRKSMTALKSLVVSSDK